MKMRPDGFEQIVDGEGFSIRSKRPFRLKCCRCGLVHRVVLVAGRCGWIGMAMSRRRPGAARGRTAP